MTSRRSYRYLGCATATAAVTPVSANDRFEFEEPDVWSVAELKKAPSHHNHATQPSRKPLRSKSGAAFDRPARSLPINVPDRSKILGGEQRRRARADDDVDEGSEPMPPHEYLARNRARAGARGVAGGGVRLPLFFMRN